MNKATIKERCENAFESFSRTGEIAERHSFELSSAQENFASEENGFFKEHKTLISALKQVFLFLPGAYYLFFLTTIFTGYLSTPPPIGVERSFYLPLLGILMLALLTIVGLGDWRNKKHLAIPGSIILLSIILGIVGSFTHGTDGFLFFVDSYVIYFLPLAFILPNLVKGLVDNNSEEIN